MEEQPRIEPQRRYVERRAEELLERIPFMEDGELRWTVRVLRDCLPPALEKAMLQDYSEHLELHQMRQVVGSFVRRYTEHALESLEAKRFSPGASLGDLTDEELQAMSAAEKWDLLRQDAAALHPDQVRRELARLFMCLNFDLFHDPSLGEAAVEFSVYLALLDGLRDLSDGAIGRLKADALGALQGLDLRDISGVERALTGLRETIGQAVGLAAPFDHLFAERLERWPRAAPAALPDVVDPQISEAVAGMNLQQLQNSLRVLVELMSLDEQSRELEGVRAGYRSLGDIPGDVLAGLLPRLSMRLGDRNICDFALRYRSGRLWARERVNPNVWKLLPFKDKFMLLEADNEAMDRLQAARHLSRLLLTEAYEVLFDPAYQVGLTREPIYHRVLDHCMRQVSDADPGELGSLNRQVTRMMLELEEMVADTERPARFREIRDVIGAAFRFGPAPEGGR
jgi:hypothetical protein